MIQDIIEVARKYYPEPVTVATISKESGVSAWTISLQMKKLRLKKSHTYPVKVELSQEKVGRGIYKAYYLPEVVKCRRMF